MRARSSNRVHVDSNRRRSWLVALASLFLLSTGCVPIPVPIRVSSEEPPPFQPAPLKPPESNELFACFVDSLTKERADIRIADASSVWEAIISVPEQGVSIDALLGDEGASAEIAKQRVDYLVSVQREVENLGKWEAGSITNIYGLPHGPYAGFDRMDHRFLAVIHATAEGFHAGVVTTAHHREGVFGGPFLPGPWFVVLPVGDPESRACKALGESLAEAIPTSDGRGSVSVILFEAEWPIVPPRDAFLPVIRGVWISNDARAALVNVLRATEETGATVTHFDDHEDPCVLRVDARSIKNIRRFEENLTASEDVAGWTRLAESSAYRIEIATQSSN